MQRPRHRKSRSASGIEANPEVQKPKVVSRLSTDSYYRANGSSANDMFMCQFGHNPSEQDTGIPMTKLLAEEMSKEFETKRRSPSVIARLMGLEALPSPSHVQRQQKTAAHSHPYDGRSNRGNSMEEKEFKDVYEDLEAAHIASRRCSSRWNANSIFMEPDISLIQEKVNEAKRLSTDEKFHSSKQLNDASYFLVSSKNMSAKFLYQPDSMCVKPVYEPRIGRKSSLGSKIAVLKPLNSDNLEGEAKSRGSARVASFKHNFTSHMSYEDDLPLESYNRRSVHVSGKSPKVLLQDKNEENILPTRIVVLKPNIGKMQSAGLPCSSPAHSHICPHRLKKMEEQHSSGRASRTLLRRNDLCNKARSSMPISEKNREVAREIARKMRDSSYDTKATNMSSGFFGYAGDESSCDPDETDFESESEVFPLSSRKYFVHNNLYRNIGTSTIKEAKKRLSERWNTTQKYQNLEVGSKGSTLGEMLSLPTRGSRLKYLHARSRGGISNALGGNEVNAMPDDPLGISSRDGWNNEAIRTSSRSRSLPPITGSSSKRVNRYESYEGRLTHDESFRCSRGKSLIGTHNHQEGYSSKISSSRGKKPLYRSEMFIDETDSSSDSSFETETTSNTKDILEDPPTFPTDLKTVTCEAHEFEEMTMAGEPGIKMSSNYADMLPEQPHSIIQGTSGAQHQEDSGCQPIGAEPESSQISKEADHPSPVSVLEVPFSEYAPSSESFERVSAELHGLRLQLQLLKMESGTLEEEVEQQLSPPIPSDANHVQNLAAEGWEIPYTLDVLIDSNIEESDFDMFRTTWFSHDSILDPKLFDALESKYGEETESLRQDRRLLFDRINSLLLEIFQENVDLHPWVMPKLARLPSKLQNESVRDALEKLINRNLLSDEMLDAELDREMKWLDQNGEIDAIGSEIESLLIYDLVADVVMCNN